MASERLLAQFMHLVRIDSESGQEREICDYLLQRLRALGLEAHEDESAAQTGHAAGNIIARAGDPERVPFLLTAHMDTVEPGKGVSPEVRDGYVVSDGTTILGADDKVGLAALLEGLEVWREQGRTLPPLELVLTVGEEKNLLGARHLDFSQLRSAYGFSLDCDGLVGTIITASPSMASLNITIHGLAVHAGVTPETGISAIQIASRAIARMHLGRIDAQTTANIGRFQGGTASNVVAGRADMVAEVRSRSKARLEAQLDHMRRVFLETAETYGGSAEVNVTYPYTGFDFTPSAPVVQHAVGAVEKLGRAPKLVASGGASDANIFAGHGIAMINLAVGYEEIHTTRERIACAELQKAADLVVALLEMAESSA